MKVFKTYLVSFLALFLIVSMFSCTTKPQVQPTETPIPDKPKELSLEEQEEMDFLFVMEAIKSEDYNKACEKLIEMIEKYPQNRSYPLLYSSILISIDQYDKARIVLNKELSINPDNMDALFALAELERFSGNEKAHLEVVKKILEKDKDSVNGNTLMGNIYYDKKDYKKAEASYKAALGVEPEHIDSMLGLARVYYRNRKSKLSKSLLDKAQELDPENAVVYIDRSKVNYQLGEYKSFVSDISKAIELDPNVSWNYIERGKYYLDIRRFDNALVDFNKAIELEPDYFLTYIYRAGILAEQGKEKEALSDYKKVYEYNSSYWYVLESIGTLSYNLEQFKGAAEAFSIASNYTKAHPEYYIYTALSLMRAGDKKAAKEYASKNLSRISKENENLYWLALRLFCDQLTQTSEIELAINKEKNYDKKAFALFILGGFWRSMDKDELASRYFELAISMDRKGTMQDRMAKSEMAKIKRLEK